MLVIDQPARADVILVLDGDSNDLRFERALNLLRAGYGKTVLLDERTDQVQFGRTQAEAAQEFIARRHLEHVEVCPGRMASTAEEVEFAAPCLVSLQAHRILIVTSAYHTRRALAIFRHCLPHYEWSVAAAQDESAYGTDWWRRRAWAKTWWSEAQRLAWWEVVDRWRYGPIAAMITRARLPPRYTPNTPGGITSAAPPTGLIFRHDSSAISLGIDITSVKREHSRVSLNRSTPRS